VVRGLDMPLAEGLNLEKRLASELKALAFIRAHGKNVST